MGRKELKQSNTDLEIHIVDLIAKFDPSRTGKFTQFLIKKLRDKWEEPQLRKLRSVRVDGYVVPHGNNRIEDTIIHYLSEVFGKENLESLHSLHNHLENNRVEGERDINQYKDWEEVQKANSLATIKYEQKRLEKEVMKVMENDEWLVIRPLTIESSLTYGAGTKWCTAMKSNKDYFYKYCRNGVLIYAINKNNGDKYGIFHDIHGNRGEFSMWNAPDQRIDSIESSIPADILKTIYQYSKNEIPNYEYFSKEEKNIDNYGHKKMSEATLEAVVYGEDRAVEDIGYDTDEMEAPMNYEMEVPRPMREEVVEDRVYRDEPQRDPWVGVPQQGMERRRRG
jgi:hypothetical protein